MTRYWFKPKRYGYGATPVTWEGWAIMLVGIVAVLTATLLLGIGDHPALWHWIVWLVVIAGTVIWLTAIFHRKTEGEWRWRWGRDS